MIKKILKFKIEIILFLLISVLYFLLRLPNLTLQPIFADEAIYIRWAQVMKAEPTLRFLSMTDGKTPLFMWLMTPFFKFINDPLFAGRLLSVVAGFFTLLGAFVLGGKFFGKVTALVAALLIAITPFIVFFDRMALVDSMLAAFSLWVLIIGIFLIKNSRFDVAMILGYILGGGILTKTTGMLNFFMLPFCFIVFNWSKQPRIKHFFKTVLCFVIAIAIGLIIYNLLRLGPGFNMLSSRNQDYIFPFSRLLTYPLDPLIPHLKDLLDWFPKLMTIPILLFTIYGIFVALLTRNKVAIVILLWLSGPLFVEALLLKTFTARYILSAISPLLIIAAVGITNLSGHIKLPNIIKYIGILVIILPLAIHFDYLLLVDPQKAPLPYAERRGYLEDWTAGYGFDKIASYFINESKNGIIIVGTEGSFGTLPDGLMIYLDKYFHENNPSKIMIVSGKSQIPSFLREAAKSDNTYFVANRSRVNQDPEGTKLIMKFDKATSPGNIQDAILVFKLLP